MIILKFCGVVRSLRNCFAHASKDVCDQLEKGNGGLEDFPLTMTWEALWKLIYNETKFGLGDILKNDPQLLPNEKYGDYKLELKIAYIKDIGYLLPIVARDLPNFYRNILGETENQKQISKLCADIHKLDRGLIYFVH